MVFSGVREPHQLLANQIVECTLRTEASLDSLRRPALLNPDFFEPHALNIALTTSYVQSILHTQPIVVELEPLTAGELGALHEPDPVLLRIGSEHPRDLLPRVKRWLPTIGVSRAHGDWKNDPVAPVRQLAALDDLVAQAGSLDDCGEATGRQREGSPWLAVPRES